MRPGPAMGLYILICANRDFLPQLPADKRG